MSVGPFLTFFKECQKWRFFHYKEGLGRPRSSIRGCALRLVCPWLVLCPLNVCFCQMIFLIHCRRLRTHRWPLGVGDAILAWLSL